MADKVIEIIKYIKSVSKQKPSVARIKTHLIETCEETKCGQ